MREGALVEHGEDAGAIVPEIRPKLASHSESRPAVARSHGIAAQNHQARDCFVEGQTIVEGDSLVFRVQEWVRSLGKGHEIGHRHGCLVVVEAEYHFAPGGVHLRVHGVRPGPRKAIEDGG